MTRRFAALLTLFLCAISAAHDIGLMEVTLTQNTNTQFTIVVDGSYTEQRFLMPTLPADCNYEQSMVAFTLPSQFVFSCLHADLPRDSMIEFNWPVAGLLLTQQTDFKPTETRLLRPTDLGVFQLPMNSLVKPLSFVASFHEFTLLGIEHLSTGYDHLLFIASIILLIGLSKKLIYAISAFTLGHSLTLALSFLGWITLRPAPVELCIALSICIVATEAIKQLTTKRPSLTFRFPGIICGTLGLLHGLGFAGALRSMGISKNELVPALLGFNVGIEIAQLCLVFAAFAVMLILRRGVSHFSNPLILQRDFSLFLPLLTRYGVGIIAMTWTLQRIPSLLLGN